MSASGATGGTESEDRLTVNQSSQDHADSGAKIFNDSVHGHIELHPLMVKIIDTPQFQRLRHIKQMGAKYFVYPGACHNRFEHSLGVAHLAGELVSTIRQKQPELDITDEDVLCVRIAGLCHDLGHGPFSHMFDGMFIPHMKLEKEWKHETGSVDMLQHLIDVNALKKEFEIYKLRDGDITFIEELIKGEMVEGVPKRKEHRGDMSFLYQIVANKTSGVDVDKWDYFARDCQHLGMSSNFDHKRFMAFVRVIEVDNRRHICLRDKEVNHLYDMFCIRKMLHQRACYHKAAVAVEFMLRDILALANDHIEIQGRGGTSWSIATCVYDMVAYSKLNDSIIQLIKIYPNPKKVGVDLEEEDEDPNEEDPLREAKDLIERLEKRQLYTCIGETTPCKDMRWFKSDDEMKRAQEILDASEDCENLTAADIIVHEVPFDYGHKGQNPIESMYFYGRDNDEPREILEEEVLHMLPRGFIWKLIRVYCKKLDSSKAQKCFDEWWKKVQEKPESSETPDRSSAMNSASDPTPAARNLLPAFVEHQN